MKTFSRTLSMIALLAWAGLLLYFYFSGRLNAYLIAAYRPYVALAGFTMLGIVASQVWSLRFGAQWQLAAGLITDDCADEVTSPGRVRATQLLAFALLVVPVWAAVGVSKDHFNADAMINRGIVTDASGLPGRPASATSAPGSYSPGPADAVPAAAAVEPPLPGATPIPADNSALDASQYLKTTASGHVIVEVTDLLFACEDDTQRPLFDGKTVEMIGQFMPIKDAPDGRFQIVRMFMVCCAADARPVAVAVLPAAGGAKAPVEMSWTRVVGTVTFPMEDGRRVALVKAQSATLCDPPAEAMLY